MQFVVPQFIDVEDKILGPLSVRQFIIIILGTGAIFGAYRFADFGLFLFEAFFILIFTMAFAFLRVNGRPFHKFIVNFIQTLKRPKLRIWNQLVTRADLRLPKVGRSSKQSSFKKLPLTNSRLAELSLVVDTGGAYKQEDYD